MVRTYISAPHRNQKSVSGIGFRPNIIKSRTEVLPCRGYSSESRTLSYYSRTNVGVDRSKLGVTRVELVPTRSNS